jgi:NCAIR mutase (PurE)-related protein
VNDKLLQVAVVSAGTTDMAIALEARETLAWFGVPTILFQDVGVAGPFRLIARVSQLRSCAAVIVVAGMEGALPSVVGGQVGVPVIAVPTSVGYGTNFGGLTALLGMLNSCAANVTVVNIDGGFKAAYVAGLIALQSGKSAKSD